jgi:hypothetical protein
MIVSSLAETLKEYWCLVNLAGMSMLGRAAELRTSICGNQSSLRDLCDFRPDPGVETAGYFQLSLSGTTVGTSNIER